MPKDRQEQYEEKTCAKINRELLHRRLPKLGVSAGYLHISA